VLDIELGNRTGLVHKVPFTATGRL
jgi:hypothetical protein